MALSLSNNFYQNVDSDALRKSAKAIFSTAAKSTYHTSKSVDAKLYSQQVGAENEETNLEAAIRLLQSKKAENQNLMAEIVSIEAAKNGQNPFYNGKVVEFNKKEARKPEYLFITVA